jgi:hypothetical protein
MGQRALWLLHTLAPRSSAYNDAGAVLFTPVPDLAALERAAAALVARHELLRTGFVEIDGQPVRVPAAPGPFGIEVRDVPGLTDAELENLADALAKRPFDLTDSGFRICLLRRSHDAAVLLAAHHIATDAFSMHIMWRDLLEAYRADMAGERPRWPALTASFDDHVDQEHALLGSPRRGELAQYWRGVANGARAAEFPADRPRPAASAFRGGTCSRVLPDEVYQQSRAAAQQLKVTLFSLLFGVLHGLLHRYAGHGELLVGCPTSVRRSKGMREVVGLLVNTIVVRSSFTPATTFADVAADIGRQLTASMSRAGYPFALMGPGGADRRPLFRVAATMVAMDTGLVGDGQAGVQVAGLTGTRLDVPHLEGQFDLTVEFTRTPASLAVVFRYDRELFDERTAQAFIDRYLALLRSASADPLLPVGRAPIAGEEEQRRLALLGHG